MAATLAARTAPKPFIFPQPDAALKKFDLSAGAARYAWFSYSLVRQTKGRWGSGYGADGKLGAPLALEWFQLQAVSEGLRTEPGKFLTVRRDDPRMWDKIGEWVMSGASVGEPGPRIYREWYMQLPKKQGKSTISSSLGIFFTGFDGEPGAEVYALAAAKGQARTVFDQARLMVLKSPRLLDEFRVYKDVIEHLPSGSIFRVLAADSDYNEGFNPHAVIIDELHVHKTRDLYDAMTSHLHTGAREDPIAITITNAGDDEDSICYDVYSQAKAVMEGRPDARRDLYPFVPELKEDEVRDKKKWKKVALASWSTVESMEEAQRAYPEYVFLRRYLNVWTSGEAAWLPYAYWDAAQREPVDVTIPKGVPIVLAADMGMTKDTTALAWAGIAPHSYCTCSIDGKPLFDADKRPVYDLAEHYEDCAFGEIRVGSHIWGIRQRNRAKNPPCHTLIEGDRFPIKLLAQYVEDVLRPQFEILEFVYDKWQMEQLAQELADQGLNMAEFPQTDQRMVPASEDIWNSIARDDILRHDGDQILTKHVMAGVIDETPRGWRINKKKTKKPCDGLVALLMAVHRALVYHRQGAPSFTVL